jgi:signal transduction histidine kinase
MLTRRDREAQQGVARPVRVALVMLVAMVVALLAVGGFATYRIYSLGNHRFVDQAGPFFAVTEDLAVEMLNQETAVRGYVITGDPRTLAPYRQGRKYAQLELDLIAKDQAFAPRIPSDLGQMRREVRSLESFFAHEIALVRSGPAGRRRAQAEILTGKGHFDHLRAASAALIADAGEVIKRSHREQRSTLVGWWIFLGVVGGIALLLAFGLILRVPRRLIELVGEEQLARREAEQSADAARALAHVREAVLLLDEHGEIRYSNPTAREWFTRSGSAFGSEIFRDGLAGLLTRDDAPAPQRLSLENGERWVTVARTEFEGGTVLVFRDVSEDQRLERLRSEFVATAAHELRTPLSAVYGAVRTLRKREELPVEVREKFLELIEHESERLKTVTDQLLVSAQLDASNLHLNTQAVDAVALCESVLDAAAAHRPADIALTLDRPDREVFVRADPDRLRQVVANLIDNAIKYSPEGGRIEARIRVDGGLGLIEVADEGIGIPDHHQERIFEKFYRLDPNMTQGVGGSGLGLYISRELVEEMGGKLALSSRFGVGSTFTVTLPLAAEVQSIRPPHVAQPDRASSASS